MLANFDKTGKVKGTKLDHLKAIEDMTGEPPPELQFTEPDNDVHYLLDHFWRIKQAAGEKISYTELKHYMDIMCSKLVAFEVEVIMQIDAIFERSIHG